MGKKNVTTNIYRIQAYYSIMCGHICMLKAKSLLDYRNLFYPNDYEKNDQIILKYFQQDLNKLKPIVIFAVNTEN